MPINPLLLEVSNGWHREHTMRRPSPWRTIRPRPWGPLASVLAFMLLAFAITLLLLTVAGLF
jgi:hypothetical protein